MSRPIRPLLLYTLLSFCALTPTLRAADAPTTRPATRPAAAGTPRAFPLDPEHGDLLLPVPATWDYTARYPAPGLPPTIEFSTGQGKRFSMQVTPIWAPPNAPAGIITADKARQGADARRRSMLAGAKETTVDLQELKGEHATGYYFTVTDKQPGAGAFECMTAGAVHTGDLLISVTILHHAKDTPERTAALEALRSATQRTPAKNAADKAPALLRIPLPIAGTSATDLVLNAGNLHVAGQRFSAARRTTELMAMDEDAGLTLSVFMEPAPRPGDASAARALYWGRMQKSPIPMKDVKLGKSGDLATVEYMVPDINQKHLNVYAAKNGIWIDVHLSKTNFTASDQPLFTNLPPAIKLEPATRN